MKRIFNFSAGPATLPVPVLDEAKAGIVNFQNKGMSVIEMSHRSKPIDELRQETEDLVSSLLGLEKKFHVLFLQGGASQQFFMVPMNLIKDRESADYIITGSWSEKALKEAQLLGKKAIEIYSSKASNFNRVPSKEELQLNQDSSYIHLTSNNTIFGTQFQQFPDGRDAPLVADMSSDIMSRPFDANPFGLIYAGAQKNLGPAGVTLVIIREDMLEREKDATPTLLRYSTQVKKQSMYNTPPVFGIYIMNLVLKWIKKSGGLAIMEKNNREKAALIYEVIDESDFYIGHAEKKSRSMMNITWNLADKELATGFLEESKTLNMDGLKGHRSVGGFRASIYNAMPRQGCETLAQFMRAFAQKNG